MKKIIYFPALFFLLIFFNSCGYHPIYKSQNFDIKIVNHSIEGDQELGRKIYSNLTRTFIGTENSKEVDMLIYAKQSKSIALKDNAGNAVKYKIRPDYQKYGYGGKSTKSELKRFTILRQDKWKKSGFTYEDILNECQSYGVVGEEHYKDPDSFRRFLNNYGVTGKKGRPKGSKNRK